MSQVPDVNNPNFYLGAPVLANGQTGGSPSVADNQYQQFISADSITNGAIVTAKEVAQSAPISATKYQAGVQAAIDAFIASLHNATKGNVNFIANVVDNLAGSAVVPDATAIDNQYAADTALVNAAAAQVAGYNDYVTSLSASGNSTAVGDLSTAASSIASGNEAINGTGSSPQPVDAQISADLAQYNADIANVNYSAAQTVMQDAITLYNNIVVSTYSNLATTISQYNSAISTLYTNSPLAAGYSQAAWNAAQAAITARNNNTSLTQFYSTLDNLPPFQAGISAIPTLGASPPGSSSFGFPSSVDANTNNAAVQASFTAMAQASLTAETTVSAYQFIY